MGPLAMLVGIGGFFAALISSRRMKAEAFAALDDTQKLAVLDAFSGHSLHLVPLAVLVMLYLGVSQLTDGTGPLITVVFWLGLLAFACASVLLSTLRLRKLDLPSSYLRSWLRGRALVFGGVLLLMGSLFLAGVR